MDITFPLALLAGGLYALSRDENPNGKPSGVVGPQPSFTPGSVDVFTEMRPLPDGSGAARYFKPDVAQMILSGFLTTQGIQPVTVQGAGPQLGLWKIVPLQAGGISAHDTAAAAQHSGFAVLGSLSMVLATDPSVDKLLFTTPDPNKGIATQQSQWAILLDGRGPVAHANAPQTVTDATRARSSPASPEPDTPEMATKATATPVAPGAPVKLGKVAPLAPAAVQGTTNGVSAHEAAEAFLGDPQTPPTPTA